MADHVGDVVTMLNRARYCSWVRRTILIGAISTISSWFVSCDDVDSSVEYARAASVNSAVRFTDIAAEAGLDFVHISGASSGHWLPEVMGSGCALLDFDNDGDLDVLLLSGRPGIHQSTPAVDSTVRLFRHVDTLQFEDITPAAGLIVDAYAMGVATGDYDNDGWCDILITTLTGALLYRNRGDGSFGNVTHESGISIDGWCASAAFLDFNRDGWLDLYVTRYLALDSDRPCPDGMGRSDYCSPRVYSALPDVLLLNDGDGTFSDVSKAAGIGTVIAHGLGVTCEDFNDDGWIDVFVANDGDANLLWINQHNGTFRDEAVMRGVAFSLDGRPEAGMGVTVGDFDGDGALDLFVTHLRTEFNRLYYRRPASPGAPDFIDVTAQSKLCSGGVRCTGFGAAAADIELDGDLDILVANGRVTRAGEFPGVELAGFWRPYAERDQVFLNQGDGRFDHGTLGDDVDVSRGLAIGDIDADGDLDVLATSADGPARLYRNDADTNDRHRWLIVRAVDPRLKRDALGARLTIHAGTRTWTRSIVSAVGYLSASPPLAHVGLSSALKVDHIDVRWPDGLHEQFECPKLNCTITLSRGSGKTLP